MKLIERNYCPFCNENKFITLYKLKYNDEKIVKFLENYYANNFLKEILSLYNYHICECIYCKGIYQKFIPDDKFNIYLYDKLISKENSFKKKNNLSSKNFKEYFYDAKLIESLINKKNYQIKILEFGCGWGFWSRFMKSLNFDVETTEISLPRVDFLKKNNIQNYQNIDQIENKYDFIFSNQVLEHVSEPLIILEKLNRILKDGGYMYHKFPSSFFFKNKVKKNYSPKKDCAHPLEHINIFNKKCFLKIADKLNLIKINSFEIKRMSILQRLILLKNDFYFNSIILKK